MRQVWRNIQGLLRSKKAFRFAAAYLALLLLVVLLLPWLPLPYTPNQLDLSHTFLRAFDTESIKAGSAHIFGTDRLGRDVLSNMLFGARTALFISVPVMLLATLLGLALGTVSGYFGDHKLRTSRKNLILFWLSLACSCYYGIYLPLHLYKLRIGAAAILGSLSLCVIIVMLLCGILTLLQPRVAYLQRQVAIPVDQVVSRFIEGLSTVPRFVLILVLASFMPPSVLLLSLILVLTLWTNVARLARAEMMRIRELPFFEAAQSMGVPTGQLLWRHAMPNLLGPVLVAFTFGLGSLLALESTLSFLNIGVPTTLVSWGRLIATIRSNTSAWWVVAFPGAFLTLTVLALYTCSHYFTGVFIKKSTQ